MDFSPTNTNSDSSSCKTQESINNNKNSINDGCHEGNPAAVNHVQSTKTSIISCNAEHNANDNETNDHCDRSFPKPMRKTPDIGKQANSYSNTFIHPGGTSFSDGTVPLENNSDHTMVSRKPSVIQRHRNDTEVFNNSNQNRRQYHEHHNNQSHQYYQPKQQQQQKGPTVLVVDDEIKVFNHTKMQSISKKPCPTDPTNQNHTASKKDNSRSTSKILKQQKRRYTQHQLNVLHQYQPKVKKIKKDTTSSDKNNDDDVVEHNKDVTRKTSAITTSSNQKLKVTFHFTNQNESSEGNHTKQPLQQFRQVKKLAGITDTNHNSMIASGSNKNQSRSIAVKKTKDNKKQKRDPTSESSKGRNKQSRNHNSSDDDEDDCDIIFDEWQQNFVKLLSLPVKLDQNLDDSNDVKENAHNSNANCWNSHNNDGDIISNHKDPMVQPQQKPKFSKTQNSNDNNQKQEQAMAISSPYYDTNGNNDMQNWINSQCQLYYQVVQRKDTSATATAIKGNNHQDYHSMRHSTSNSSTGDLYRSNHNNSDNTTTTVSLCNSGHNSTNNNNEFQQLMEVRDNEQFNNLQNSFRFNLLKLIGIDLASMATNK